MSTNALKITQTTSNKLSTIPVKAGSLYFVTDTEQLFMDTIEQTPKRIEYTKKQ